MSDNDPSTDSDNPLADLSSLNFGPAWARDKPKGKPRNRPESDADRKGGRSNQGGGDRRRNQGDQRGGGGRGQASGGRDNRDFRGRGRRDDRRGRDHQDRKPPTPAPEGITGRVMPIEEGLDAIAKDIAATGRTHSVFDIAWLVLGGLERFHVVFESEDQTLYRSKKDHSLWLYQKECMAHFWAKGIAKRYYDEEIVDVDPPKGNFQSVARCGMSGALIGPPNHHAYQKTLLDLHREKFSQMALDRYKSKVVMEHGEEVVQEWLDSMTKHVRWRPKSEKVEVETAEKVTATAEVLGSDDSSTEVLDETCNETSDETARDESAPTEQDSPDIEETVAILDSHLEVEQHFLSHGFDLEFESGKVMSVLANVPPKMIDPGLFTLLKTIVTDERRYPGKLASILCRQMSGRHLAVFKWKKHLHCGPARPRNVSDNMVMAERPSALFHWVIANPGGNIDAMWKSLLPGDVDDEARHLWYHDLHWLINEGIVLLFSDGKLHAAKEIQKKGTKPGKSKKSGKLKKSEKSKKSGNPEKSEKSEGAEIGESESSEVDKVDVSETKQNEEKVVGNPKNNQPKNDQ